LPLLAADDRGQSSQDEKMLAEKREKEREKKRRS